MPEPLSQAVFLVSGGARGITAACVTALARAHGGAFILVGRTPVDPHPGLDPSVEEGAPDDELRRRIASMLSAQGEKATPIAVDKVLKGARARQEIAQTLDGIERAGGRARYIAVDVTDGPALQKAVASAGMGRVSGIIHGAGMLADKRIEAKSEQDITRVFATKVHGLRAMLSAVDEANLSHLALFASTSGFHGNVGQSDHAAANEVLNKFAHAFERRFPACRTVVFDWGPWDGGMVTPFLKSLFESHGVRVMSVETGARVFVEVLGKETSSVQVLVNDVGPPQVTPAARRAQPALRVSRVLGVDKNPFLRDHVINGHPVLPAACAGLWMANVRQQASPGFRFVSLSDFRVLKGLVFDGTAVDKYRVEIEDEEASGDAITQSVVITSTTRDQKPRYHYRGTVRLAHSRPGAPEPRRFDLTSDPRFEALKPYAEGALFHGPTFQAITRVLAMGPKRITARCCQPRSAWEVFGQFPPVAFDAVALDAQFQCLGLWAHHVMGAAALPTSWARYEVFATPPANEDYYVTAEVDGKSDFAIGASMAMHDAEGRIFAQTLGVELTVHRPAAAVATAPDAKTTKTSVAAAISVPEAKAANSRMAFDGRGSCARCAMSRQPHSS